MYTTLSPLSATLMDRNTLHEWISQLSETIEFQHAHINGMDINKSISEWLMFPNAFTKHNFIFLRLYSGICFQIYYLGCTHWWTIDPPSLPQCLVSLIMWMWLSLLPPCELHKYRATTVRLPMYLQCPALFQAHSRKSINDCSVNVKMD